MKNYVELIFENKPGNRGKCALVDRNGQRETCWGELYDGACRVAAYARSKNLTGLVPVCMPRCAENVKVMLGLGLAGLGVAPLSDHTPENRVKLIEQQSENAAFTFEDYKAAMKFEAKPFAAVDFAPDAPAYVVYTSGSTGVPKGVMLSNDTVVKSYKRMASAEFLELREGDVVLQSASFSFVALMIDLFAPLYVGCVSHILPEEARLDIGLMTDYINAHGITSMFITPKPLSRMGDAPSLRVVCVGGERVTGLGPKGYRLLNVWGMSETAALALGYNITEPMEKTPIGKSLGDFRTYILDEEGNISDEGELCLSGAFTSGYFKRPELTAKSFEPNPFTTDEGHTVLMHTGDIVRRLPDGNILYLNRKDFMIKINGQRVEPGEAEAVIEQIGGVRSVAVKGFIEPDGRSYLCAYYVADDAVTEDTLRAELKKHLPEYMIPAFFVKLDALPLNSNGKLDRRALAEPAAADRQSRYEEAVNTNELKLCRAFEKVLKLERVGVNDDFLRLGGDSIRAMSVVSLAEIEGLKGSDILAGRTPRNIAALVSADELEIYNDLPRDNARAPLTDSQLGVYLACIQSPESTMYNIPVHLSFARNGKSCEEIRKAVDTVIARHPALLSRIDADSEPVCMVRTPMPKGGICTASETDEAAVSKALETPAKPFELTKAPLCRVTAMLTDEKVHILMDIHHTVADGTSVSVLVRELVSAAAGESTDSEKTDAFALSDVEAKAPGRAEAREYFRNLLAGVETDSNLIFDKKPMTGGILRSETLTFALGNIDLSRLREYGITESSFFMGVYGYALAKMTGQTGSLFIAGESGRKSAAVSNTVAMMVRTLPVVMSFDEKQRAGEVLRQVQEQFFASVRYDCCSFGELVREYGINTDVTFVYQSDMLDGFDSALGHADVQILPTGCAYANLAAAVYRTAGGYRLNFDYRTDLYDAKTIERFAKLYASLAAAFAGDAVLAEMPLISDEDTAFLDTLNKNEYEYNKDETIIDIFRRTVRENPDKTLVVSGDTRYTYAEADDLTDRLAAYIHSLGIGREQTVSVLIPRCEYMVLASLGIMKAGAMYQPLDPSYPPERLGFMRKDADSKLLISDRSLIGILTDFEGAVLYTDEIPALPKAPKTYDDPGCDDGFVLLYTSGTTGTPKGCMLMHRNLVAISHSFSQVTGMDSTVKAAAYASYGFDAHMTDIYPVILNGGEVHIIREDIRLDLPAVKEYCERNGITHMVMTTQVCRQMATEFEDIKGLKCLLCGGEKLVSFEPKGNYRIINGYGPTECTVMGTAFHVDKLYDDIPIGKAISNFKLYVVDAQNRRVPVGAPGELIMCGPQVGKKYLNREEQTSKVFVPNTFEPDPGEDYLRCYRTGDIVRFADDGNLMFIGRRDMQVKIRGFRIELTEVERVIRDYPGITDAVVVARDDPSGGKCIHAYIVSDQTVDIARLNAFIRSEKPPYMVPAATMQIDRIPLTPNQKVDKRKLPPISSGTPRKKSSGERSLNTIEKALSEILAEIVGHKDFDVDTDFGEAGITSITSIRLAVQIYKRFALHITSKDLLDGGSILTVENMIIESLLNKRPETEEKPREQLRSYPLTQTQVGIYTDCLRAGMEAYNVPMLLKIPRGIDIEKFKKAAVEAVRSHPSMLCYIHPDEKGDVAVYPAADMEISVEDEYLAEPKCVPTRFSFTEAPLFRIRILHCGEDNYLSFEAHHIIFDGESFGVLIKDIDKAYRGEKLCAEKYTAYDMSVDEQAARNGSTLTQAHSYYDSVFRGVSADYLPNPDINGERSRGAGRFPMSVNAQDAHRLCEKLRVTENVLFTGAFALLLSRFTGHDDALFATVYNGRNDPRTAELIGMLVKTLPVYASVSGEIKTGDFLAAMEKHLRLLKKNDVYSFADAAHDYGVNANVIFIYQGQIIGKSLVDGRELELINEENEAPKAEISVEVYLNASGFETVIEYNAGRYSEEWISTFADAFDACVNSLLVSATLGEVDISSEKSMAEFAGFNNTDWDIPYRPVYRLLEERTRMHPERIAVVAGDTKLTFRQLDRMSNALARELISRGVEPLGTVEIMLGRTAEIYVAEYGILKAGCAFLFVSAAYPDERIEFINRDADAKALVTTHETAREKAELFAALNIPIVFADDIEANTEAESTNIYVEPDALAYMIYTSGSTGKPKGVMVKQKGLVNLSDANPYNKETTGFATGSSISTAVSAFTFDASVMEGIVCLNNGSTVCIASDEMIHNPALFTEYCLKNHVSSFFGTPSFVLNMLDYPGFAEAVRTFEAVKSGGEAFTAGLYEKLRAINKDMRIINGYGPSEATIACSCKFLTSADSITVGTPLANTKLYCVDKNNHILPMGALGELTVLGDCVGAGYLNRDDLTKKSFITLMGKPAYKTGDLACITHGGEIEFHGRIDDQIKLRGLRVELGEIESAIEACPGVKKSVVCVYGDEKNRFLAAYYTADRQIEPKEITESISKTLTEYMVPRILMQLESLPLTANGKVDKKALPKPEIRAEKREYAAPTNETEKLLCREFAEILGVEKVGIDDDFFELGGTSLTATKVAMFALAHDLPIVYADVFKYATVRKLASLASDSSGTETEKKQSYDYSGIDRVLSKNTRDSGAIPGDRPLGNILLTGATGFLGMHILKRFLDTESGEVYCLLRKGGAESIEMKLMSMFVYYFDRSIESEIGTRIHCIDGDITDKVCVDSLASVPFDTLFNCAACVKHFTNDDTLERVNVTGVENLVDLCMDTGRRLIHVSTVSIAGESIDGKPSQDIRLRENALFFGQTLENEYINTKFRSERAVLAAAAKGLDAKIMRAGNLMPRRSDGEFQINYLTNGFMRRLHGYYVLGCIGYSQLSAEMEFSPIDDTAAAMVTLAKTDSRYTVFHTNNNHRMYLADVISAMNRAGLPVECVDDGEFASRLKKALEDADANQAVSGLIAYMNRDHADSRRMIDYDNAFTADMLYRLNAGWQISDYDYICNALRTLKEFGFFDLDL